MVGICICRHVGDVRRGWGEVGERHLRHNITGCGREKRLGRDIVGVNEISFP